jgi:esterase/lipase
MEYEDVFFPALDGTVLEGWFIPADSDKLVICNHFSPANRYGYPGHLEPWDQMGGFEVNFLPKYKALHQAGYNVLAYDLRNHGLSGSGAGGIFGSGLLEWRDVIGSVRYAKSRKDTADMRISLQSICLGCDSTFIAMRRRPEEFKHIVSMIAIQPISGRPLIERACENVGIEVDKGIEIFDEAYRKLTSFRVDDTDMTKYAKSVELPTFVIQVRDDMMTKPSDVQSIYDNIPVEDKKLFWIEGTTLRYHGYTYFSERPEQMIEWYDSHA